MVDYNKAIELEPDNADFYWYRGYFFSQIGEYENALADYNKAIELDPDDLNFLFERAKLYNNALENYEKSLTDYLRIIELDTDQEFAKTEYIYNNIAALYREYIKDYQKALEYYTKEIEISPENGVPYIDRAQLYFYSLDNKEKALIDYKKAIELEPDRAAFYLYRGNYFRQIEEYQNALADFNKAIELDPEDFDYLERKAVTFIDLKQYQNAIDLYRDLINQYTSLVVEKKIDNNEGIKAIISYYEQISVIYFEFLNDNDKSLIYVEKAIKAYSDLNEEESLSKIYSIGLRGKIFMNKGQLGKAKEDFLEAIEIDPEYRNSYFNLINYYLKTRNYNEAIRTIDKTIEMDYNDPDGFYKKSLIYFELEKYLNSLIYVSKAILKSEEDDRLAKGEYYISDLNNIDKIELEDLFAFRANLFLMLGDKKEAINDYKSAINLTIDTEKKEKFEKLIEQN